MPTSQGMETIFVGKDIVRLTSVDSTNNYAAKMMEQDVLSDGTVILAYDQTAGKGQRGNDWNVEPGANLTCSVVFRACGVSLRESGRLMLLTSLALSDTLGHFNISHQIKWPNDLLVDRKKISGILIENTVRGGLIKDSIIGIGLNVNQTSFGDIVATSLKNEGVSEEVENVLKVVLAMLEKWYMKGRSLPWDQLKDAYLNQTYGFNQEVELLIDNRQVKGSLIDILKSGQAKFLIGNEEVICDLKEISFVL